MHTNENNIANTWGPTAENQVHVTAPVERNTCPAASTFHNVCQCVGHTYEPSTQAVGYRQHHRRGHTTLLSGPL